MEISRGCNSACGASFQVPQGDVPHTVYPNHSSYALRRARFGSIARRFSTTGAVMAKKQDVEDEMPEDGAPQMATAEDIDQLLKNCLLKQADMDSARGEIGSLVKDAENTKNVHRKAFKMLMQVERMEDGKKAEFLRNLFYYFAIRGHMPHPDLFEGDEKVVNFVKKVRRDTGVLDQMEAAH
jgi:hypothetical protein